MLSLSQTDVNHSRSNYGKISKYVHLYKPYIQYFIQSVHSTHSAKAKLKMENLNKLSVCSKPAIKICKLHVGTPYKIFGGKFVNTKYGKSVLLELENNVIFLPKRYAEAVTNENIQNFNTSEYGVTVVEITTINDQLTADLNFSHLTNNSDDLLIRLSEEDLSERNVERCDEKI
ncbi:hypothetical protein QE152_g27662 [Popillia japonica]|uniref:Uncharacterized protein n=1 Tax=Popillia japonica TaxID=7064 RepID=A0AAW1JVL9_POPJA